MDYTDIGARIREARKVTGMTQEQLAEAADLSVSHIRQVEIGLKHVSLAALSRIAESLDTSVQTLLTSEESGETVRLQVLLADCTAWEQSVIADVAEAVAKALRKHRAAYVSLLKRGVAARPKGRLQRPFGPVEKLRHVTY